MSARSRLAIIWGVAFSAHFVAFFAAGFLAFPSGRVDNALSNTFRVVFHVLAFPMFELPKVLPISDALMYPLQIFNSAF